MYLALRAFQDLKLLLRTSTCHLIVSVTRGVTFQTHALVSLYTLEHEDDQHTRHAKKAPLRHEGHDNMTHMILVST